MGNTVLTTVRRNDGVSQATSQNRTSFVNAARLRLARSDVRDAPAGGTERSAAVARDEGSTEPRAVRLLLAFAAFSAVSCQYSSRFLSEPSPPFSLPQSAGATELRLVSTPNVFSWLR
jgi:hypothetical protein